jgi:hypothetical protein
MIDPDCDSDSDAEPRGHDDNPRFLGSHFSPAQIACNPGRVQAADPGMSTPLPSAIGIGVAVGIGVGDL